MQDCPIVYVVYMMHSNNNNNNNNNNNDNNSLGTRPYSLQGIRSGSQTIRA